MLKKLRALGIIIGLVSPVADLIRALAALNAQKSRILSELLDRFHADIDIEVNTEPALQGVRTALLVIERKITEAAASGAFKATILLGVALLLAPAAQSQTPPIEPPLPTLMVTAGANWNQDSVPQINGLLMIAKQIPQIDAGTYSFSFVDITSRTWKPFTVQIAVSTGLGHQLFEFGRAHVFAIATAGLAAGGSSVGAAWSAGGAAIIPLGQKGVVTSLSGRVLKPNPSDFRSEIGMTFGWGK